jgi:23S rRNA pseudouridine2457 synthase
MLSQLGTEGYKKKRGLSELFDFPKGVYPVGRLDEDSEGLLMMTSDSKLSVQIRSASIEKEYWVQLDGEITDEAIAQLQIGLHLVIKKETILTKPCKAWKINEPHFEERYPPTRAGHHRPYSWLAIVLYEGKFRQVRKMTAAVGFPTLRLVRVRIGDIRLDDMKTGEVRPMETLI